MTATLLGWVESVAAGSLEKDDVYLSLSVLGSIPASLTVTDRTGKSTAASWNAVGAGFKAGVYPKVFGHAIGVEVESYGHGLAARFDGSRADMMIFNTMLNLLLRYPGRYIQPYIGIGAGYSHGLLTDTEVIGRSNRMASAQAFGHQFLGGLRADSSPRTYLFAEYRYFLASYHWEGFALQLREHLVAAGVGLRF